MALHMIYCDTREMANFELSQQREDLGKEPPPTLYDDNGLVGRIVAALGIVDAGNGNTLPDSHKWTASGCRWGVLVEVDESYDDAHREQYFENWLSQDSTLVEVEDEADVKAEALEFAENQDYDY